jgi:hypothetical protein
MAELTGLEGVYSWSYAGGSFQVELRPFGSFYCKSYPATATWTLVDKTLTVDWKKYGKYELDVRVILIDFAIFIFIHNITSPPGQGFSYAAARRRFSQQSFKLA